MEVLIMSEEKKQILDMLQQGKISTDEAMKLLDALEVGEEPIKQTVNKDQLKDHFLRIKVKDKNDIVNVNLPLTLVSAGLKIAEKFDSRIKEIEALKDIDFDEIIKLVKNGEQGKIIEVKTDSETVEIYVD